MPNLYTPLYTHRNILSVWVTTHRNIFSVYFRLCVCVSPLPVHCCLRL